MLAALEKEPSSNVVAARFGVSGSFVRKLRQKVKVTGKVAATPPPGKERFVDARGETILRQLVEQRPDATLDALVRLFPRHGGRKVSDTTIWRTLCRMGMSLKKRPFTQLNVTGQMLSSAEPPFKKRKRRGIQHD